MVYLCPLHVLSDLPVLVQHPGVMFKCGKNAKKCGTALLLNGKKCDKVQQRKAKSVAKNSCSEVWSRMLLQLWNFWHVSFIFKYFASTLISFNVLDCHLIVFIAYWQNEAVAIAVTTNSSDHVTNQLVDNICYHKFALESSSSWLKLKLWDGRFQITWQKTTEGRQPVSQSLLPLN